MPVEMKEKNEAVHVELVSNNFQPVASIKQQFPVVQSDLVS